MFLNPNEHILIMEDVFYSPFDAEDVKYIVQSGIQTVHPNGAVCWNELIKQSSPKFDFSSLDRRLEKYLSTDLKIILPFYYTMPIWFPDDWYYHKDTDLTHIIPNLANKDFVMAVDDFLFELLEHFSDVKDKIHFTFGIPSGGEFLWDAYLTKDFPFPDEVIFDFIIGRQKLLAKQHGEIWLYLHTFLGDPQNWNNLHLPLLYFALKEEFPNLPFYSVEFAHFAVGNSLTDQECQSRITKYTEEFGIRYFVGSQYVEGLHSNFTKAINQKAYGFIACPNMACHPMKHKHIQKWMVEEISLANEKWVGTYGNY